MRGDIPTSEGLTVATMATFPARAEAATQAVASLAPQVDRLYLYLNGYDSVPAFAEADNVVPIAGGPDLSANGKTFALDYIQSGIVVMADDDFIYPSDYVRRLTALLQRHHGQVLAAVHGSVIAPEAKWYFERSKIYSLRRALEPCRFAMLAGSGTAAFDQSALQLRHAHFAGDVAVDLRLSARARSRHPGHLH